MTTPLPLLRKLYAVYAIYLKECFAYPAASFIWMLSDVQAAVVLPAVWIAAAGPGGIVGGMDRNQLVAYYLISMTLSQFTICHLLWDIAFDIREGFFSAQIVRPISFFAMNIARNLAWRVAKLTLFVPVLLLVFWAYGGVQVSSLDFSWPFWLSVALAQMLSYVSAFCVSLVALWTTEFMSIFRLYYFPEMFLSGRLLPLATMPFWVQEVARFTHFPYMLAFPTNMLLGKLSSPEIERGLFVQVAWIFVFTVLGRVLFARGLRQYSGVGM